MCEKFKNVKWRKSSSQFILCLWELLWFHFITVPDPGSGSGTVINYGSGSDYLARYGSGSAGQKVPTVPVPIPTFDTLRFRFRIRIRIQSLDH